MKKSLECALQRKIAAEREALRLSDKERWSQQPPRYTEWLDFFFGRFERDSDDPWQMHWEFPGAPAEIADLFICTFMNSGAHLAPYSDGQVSTGLQALLFTNFGDVPHVLTAEGVSEGQRLAILRSFGPLYRDLLAKRAPAVLGHKSESVGNPLEFVTYMLWDVTPFDYWAAKTEERMAALMDVFHDTLRLPNESCVESVLHGLGHLGGTWRSHAQSMIQDWLDEGPCVRADLIAYAKAAQTGCIL